MHGNFNSSYMINAKTDSKTDVVFFCKNLLSVLSLPKIIHLQLRCLVFDTPLYPAIEIGWHVV